MRINSIGIGTAIKPGLGLLTGLAIVVDNLSEALSIGLLIRNEPGVEKRGQLRRVLGWTGLIGAALLDRHWSGGFFCKGYPNRCSGFSSAAAVGECST